MNENRFRDAKVTFMDACSEWADLLIADSVRQVENGNERWKIDPEKMIPEGFPPAQAKVWKAGYQLMLDSFDAVSGECSTRNIPPTP